MLSIFPLITKHIIGGAPRSEYRFNISIAKYKIEFSIHILMKFLKKYNVYISFKSIYFAPDLMYLKIINNSFWEIAFKLHLLSANSYLTIEKEAFINFVKNKQENLEDIFKESPLEYFINFFINNDINKFIYMQVWIKTEKFWESKIFAKNILNLIIS